MQRLRTANKLTFRLRHDAVLGANPAVGATRRVPDVLWQLLRDSQLWTSREVLREHLAGRIGDPTRADLVLDALITDGFLLEEGSEAAKDESQFISAWPFGETTADHHLVTRSLEFSDDRTEAVSFGRALRDHVDDDLAPTVGFTARCVPLPSAEPSDELRAALERRRSRRDFIADPISLTELSTVLWVTAGVQAYRRVPHRPPLPLTFAPSAGGLNGTDCYVIAQNVTDLTVGIYRYRPASDALETVATGLAAKPERLLGNQRWAAKAAAIIVLVADTRRTAWKYDAASGFNALLLQAGHMAQNALLAAADLGLGAVPSNAIHVKDMEQTLALSQGLEIILTSVSLGHVDGPDSTYMEYEPEHLALLGRMVEQ